jgi:hypothetical protein
MNREEQWRMNIITFPSSSSSHHRYELQDAAVEVVLLMMTTMMMMTDHPPWPRRIWNAPPLGRRM